jgi:tetratricopeptide (TPR) repeat protein
VIRVRPSAAIFVLTFGLAAALSSGCGSRGQRSRSEDVRQETAAPDDVRSLPTPDLPDLSGASTAVERQMRDQYAVLLSETSSATYGRMGMLLMAAEYRQAAAPFLMHAQALDHVEVRWPYYLAHLHRLNGETAKALPFFERAHEIQPQEEAILIWLANAYLDLNRLDAAREAFSTARTQHPKSAAAFSGLGRTALTGRDYSHAVEYLEEALSIDPRATAVHYHLALAYRGLGRLDAASAHMRRRGDRDVQLADPLLDELWAAVQSPFTYEHLGVEATNRGDYPAAIAQFRRGLQLAPDDTSLRHRLGITLTLTGDNRAAAEEFYEVLRREPGHASTNYALGVLHAANRRYAEAIEHFTAVLQSNPSYAEARLQLADALRRSGRPQESLIQFDEAGEADPRLADVPLGYAMALVALRRFGEARDRLLAASARFPECPAIAHALVRLLAAAPDDRVRDGSRAVTLAQALLDQEPPSPDLGEVAAMAMAEAGRFDEAVLWQQRGIGLAGQTQRVEAAKRMTATLELFVRGKPSRSPWRDGDPLGGDAATPF